MELFCAVKSGGGSQNSEKLETMKKNMDYSSWLTKAQAAEAIGVSTKTIEKLAAEKKIQQGAYKRSATGASVAVYHPDDVARIRKERNPDAEPFVLTTAQVAQSESRELSTVDQSGGMRSLLEMFASQNSQKQSAVTLDRKPLLTISEASEYTGLSREILLNAHREGKLAARKIGKAWRMKRADVDGYVGGLEMA